MLYELDLASVNGGKINWGSVAGHCAGGAIIGGAFSGGLAAGIGCVVGSGKAIIGGL
ncbi:bacteriocin subunit [Streptococcus equi subsp. zooepidemicus ATCC 35246]|nr:bacteriocin subunit [Streptococcus equi subsp. zooepidemicus ATCC 35246]